MSLRRRLRAGLPGSYGPLFPQGVDELNELVASRPTTYQLMVAVCRAIPGFQVVGEKLSTIDGYRWRLAIEFAVAESTVLITLPHHFDGSWQNDTNVDCSVAVYVGHLDISPDDLVQRLVEELRAYKTRRQRRWSTETGIDFHFRPFRPVSQWA